MPRILQLEKDNGFSLLWDLMRVTGDLLFKHRIENPIEPSYDP